MSDNYFNKLPAVLSEQQRIVESGVIQEFGYESGATRSKESRCTPHFHIPILE